MDAGPAEVDAALGTLDPGHAVDGEIGGRDTELVSCGQRIIVGLEDPGVDRALTSFEPRPKPEITLPFIWRGNGCSGPLSGPMILGRGPLGRIVKDICYPPHPHRPRIKFLYILKSVGSH